MKILVLIFSILFLFSCSSNLPILKEIPKKENFYGIDFVKYSQLGFLITPEKYSKEYESIGLINYELFPSALYVNNGKILNPNWVEYSKLDQYIDSFKWEIESITVSTALDSIYNQCIILGADAIVNFDCQTITETYSNIQNPVIISGIKISGFAIKRK